MFRKVEPPSLLDVLDRILDKGIVVDAWVRFSLIGIDFLTLEARIVVASLQTYLDYAEVLRTSGLQSPPAQNPKRSRLRGGRLPRVKIAH